MGAMISGGEEKTQIFHISKSIALRIKIFSPIDLATPVSYLSVMRYVTLTPLFFELFSKTILHVLHAGGELAQSCTLSIARTKLAFVRTSAQCTL